jgi:hypothetical protein
VARLPPIVARLRSAGEPTERAAWASATKAPGSRAIRAKAGELAHARQVEERGGPRAPGVDVDPEVGAACDRDRVGPRGAQLERLVERAGDEDVGHARTAANASIIAGTSSPSG